MSGRGSRPEPRPPFRVAYDAGLVEEAVLLAESRLPAMEAAGFRGERNRIYDVEDDEEREARFEELHGRYFLRLGLDAPLHRALLERPELLQRARACRVLPASAARDEGADVLREVAAPPGTPPTIVVRLRTGSLVASEALATLLRRELLHVADMLDPAFGYESELLRPDDDPAVVSLLRERYRVLWDASVDGRLCRGGRLAARERDLRLAEFRRAFPILETGDAAFARWFDGPRPRHEALVAFAREPLGPGTADGARCPVCRSLAWSAGEACCARCAEVFAAYGAV